MLGLLLNIRIEYVEFIGIGIKKYMYIWLVDEFFVFI